MNEIEIKNIIEKLKSIVERLELEVGDNVKQTKLQQDEF